MGKKKLLGNPEPPSQYVIITNLDGGLSNNTGQTANYITLRQVKKIVKDESNCAYIFKVPKYNYCNNPLLKYPLQ